jgi:cell division protein FtsL
MTPTVRALLVVLLLTLVLVLAGWMILVERKARRVRDEIRAQRKGRP